MSSWIACPPPFQRRGSRCRLRPSLHTPPRRGWYRTVIRRRSRTGVAFRGVLSRAFLFGLLEFSRRAHAMVGCSVSLSCTSSHCLGAQGSGALRCFGVLSVECTCVYPQRCSWPLGCVVNTQWCTRKCRGCGCRARTALHLPASTHSRVCAVCRLR